MIPALTPELVALLLNAGFFVGGAILHHKFPFLAKLLSQPSVSPAMPAQPKAPDAPSQHPLLDAVLRAEQQMLDQFRQSIFDRLTQPAPAKPPA